MSVVIKAVIVTTILSSFLIHENQVKCDLSGPEENGTMTTTTTTTMENGTISHREYTTKEKWMMFTVKVIDTVLIRQRPADFSEAELAKYDAYTFGDWAFSISLTSFFCFIVFILPVLCCCFCCWFCFRTVAQDEKRRADAERGFVVRYSNRY